MQSLNLKDDKKETSSSSHRANEWGWVWPTLARIVDSTQWYLRCKGPNTQTYRDVGFSKLIWISNMVQKTIPWCFLEGVTFPLPVIPEHTSSQKRELGLTFPEGTTQNRIWTSIKWGNFYLTLKEEIKIIFKAMVITTVMQYQQKFRYTDQWNRRSETDAHLHGQLGRRGREAKTEPLATSTSLSALRAGLPFPTNTYSLFTDDSQAYILRYNFWANNADNSYISIWMLYCHIRHTVKISFASCPQIGCLSCFC